GVVAAIALPWPTVEHSPASAQVSPLPGDTVLVCNGDLRALGRDTANAAEMTTAGDPTLTVHGFDGDPASVPLSTPELQDGSSAQALSGAVENRKAPLIAASESITLASEDLDGLAAAPCRE